MRLWQRVFVFGALTTGIALMFAEPIRAQDDAAAVPTRVGLMASGAGLLDGGGISALVTGRTVYLRNLETGAIIPVFFGHDGLRHYRVDGRVARSGYEVRERSLCSEVPGAKFVCALVFGQRDEDTDVVTYWLCEPGRGGRCHWMVEGIVAGNAERF